MRCQLVMRMIKGSQGWGIWCGDHKEWVTVRSRVSDEPVYLESLLVSVQAHLKGGKAEARYHPLGCGRCSGNFFIEEPDGSRTCVDCGDNDV